MIMDIIFFEILRAKKLTQRANKEEKIKREILNKVKKLYKIKRRKSNFFLRKLGLTIQEIVFGEKEIINIIDSSGKQD